MCDQSSKVTAQTRGHILYIVAAVVCAYASLLLLIKSDFVPSLIVSTLISFLFTIIAHFRWRKIFEHSRSSYLIR